MFTEFTPFASFVGGTLIGVAVVAFMAGNGRVAGISGIVAGLMPPFDPGSVPTRLAFVAGLAGAPLTYTLVTDVSPAQSVSGNLVLMAAAGVLVGFGSVFGGGCTSGHGVCGLARLSPRSAMAAATFMATAIVVVFVMRHVLGA